MTDNSPTDRRVQAALLGLILFASGFAGLGYEMVLSKMLAVALGHETIAVLAVVSAFFVGIGLGAWLLDSRIRSTNRPALWYAALEFVIGVWSLTLIVIVPQFNAVMPELLGESPPGIRHWVTVFLATLLLLAPATVAMGATLPAMERLFARSFGRHRAVAGLYAANTGGAVIGILATTYALAPALGYATTLTILSAVNVLCATGVLMIQRRPVARPVPVARSILSGNGRLTVTLAATGALGIGFEVAAIRVLTQVLDNTLYTFANLLAIYLLGTALGAALYQRWLPESGYRDVLHRLLSALALSVPIGAMALMIATPLHRELAAYLGNGYVPAILGELIVAGSVFLLPTVLMGATFAHLAQHARDRIGLGRALALNTFGGACAPPLIGLIVIPLVGTRLTLALIAVGYLALLPSLGRVRERWLGAVPAIGTAALVLAPIPWQFVTIPDGGELLHYDEGPMAAVAVVTDASATRYLKVNDAYTMGSSDSGYSDARQTHLPLLLHASPDHVLYLGLGTGGTFAAVAAHSGVTATAVELVPGIPPVIGQFGSSIAAIADSDRLDVVVSDARRYVSASRRQFDVIIADVFHPSRDGAASLYTVEHFSAVRERLEPDGLFCQWLPLFQLDLATLRTITRSFQAAFPQSDAYLAHLSLGQPLLALVGRNERHTYHRGWLRQRVGDQPRLIAELNRLELNSDYALFGNYVGGDEALRRFAGDAPLNTDDHPIVAFTAPGFLYAGATPAAGRLLAMLDEVRANPATVVSTGQDSFARRLTAYWQARNEFLRAGRQVTPTDDPLELLAAVSSPLLRVVEISDDFVPAYRPLLRLAYDIYPRHPEQARTLLDDLVRAGPGRTEARALRHELFGS